MFKEEKCPKLRKLCMKGGTVYGCGPNSLKITYPNGRRMVHGTLDSRNAHRCCNTGGYRNCHLSCK